jgi:DNA (cytosine-5)-methyltransferase 1
MGESEKPKTRKQIIKWLQEKQGDSAEYKALGNSVAIPCVEYVMEGIADVLRGSIV